MGLSYVIEYLLSLERPSGGRLCYAGVSQLIIPIFPPNTTITLESGPLGSDYAYLPYLSTLGPAMVPSAFSGWGQQYGSRQYTGVLTSWFLNNILDSFAFVTDAEPGIAQITNQTALFQYYEGMVFIICIATEADYHMVLEALKRLSTSARSEQLAAEANLLLRSIATGEPPAPQPPIGGE